MRLLAKAGLGVAILFAMIAVAPAAKADPIVITTGGFSLINLGNNGGGASGKDSLNGAAASSSHNFSAPGSFVALLNPLTFTTGFTGPGSSGTYSFNFSQPLTISGVTQTLNLVGRVLPAVRTTDCNPVPEPATLSLLGLGLAGVAAKLRQRRLRRV